MRGAEETQMRVIGPAEAREEHRRQHGLGEARRDVDQQPVYLARVDSLQMVADGLHMPSPDQRISRLYDMPSVLNKRAQITLAGPLAPPQIQFCRYWRYR